MLAILLFAGCTAEREFWPEERLDPETAVNVTIMADPWVYSRDVPMLAANARDYLNVGVVETNRAGTRATWLGVIAWSTIDRSVLPGQPPPIQPEMVRLVLPASTMELKPVAGGRSAVGISEPVLIDPTLKFTDSWYALTNAQVQQLGAGAPASVALVNENGDPTTFERWQVNDNAMSEFLKAVGL